MPGILFICTGNLCRSPSAAGLFTQRLHESGPDDVNVDSVGTVQAEGDPPGQMLVEALAYGLDLRVHKPRRMRRQDVTEADLIVGMARNHVREAVLLDPSAFAYSFTLRDLVRRAEEVGPRQPHQTLASWLSVVGVARRHADLVGESAIDDIPDPMGGPPEGYRLMLAELSTLTAALYALLWGTRRDAEVV